MDDEVEWDSRKAATNLKKHGVDFADAAIGLHDDQALTIRNDQAAEERDVTIGMDALARSLSSSTRGRSDRPRLLSARNATPREGQEDQVKP
jgi:uncharacterized protein